MAMSGRTTCSSLAALLILVGFFAANAHALEVVNKQSCKLTVFAPPICEPCECAQIQCKKAPCEQLACFCTLQCKAVPGVDVKVGRRVTLQVKKEDFPLSFLTVEVKGLAYVVKAVDLKSITRIATVVVTRKPCGRKGKQGLAALVCRNLKFAQCERICLVGGERYGS